MRPRQRSIALHALIAHHLLNPDPMSWAKTPEQHLEAARTRVRWWLETGEGAHPVDARRWLEILEGSTAEVARFLTDESDEAAELRSVSPFAGVLFGFERWLFLRELCGQ